MQPIENIGCLPVAETPERWDKGNCSGWRVHGLQFTMDLFAVLFISLLQQRICSGFVIASGVLQELDKLSIWFRIEPVFHQSNFEPLNVEPERLRTKYDSLQARQSGPRHNISTIKRGIS